MTHHPEWLPSRPGFVRLVWVKNRPCSCGRGYDGLETQRYCRRRPRYLIGEDHTADGCVRMTVDSETYEIVRYRELVA